MSLRIAVCVKQVPLVAAMKFDTASKTLVREGVPMEVSAFDRRALLRAVELRDEHGGEVVVITMGPPAAVEALAECLALGADRAVHLCDRAFAGADTLATAQALAQALRREVYDLVLCGRNSVDAETGQVGPEVAELLGWPQVTGARSLAVDGVARTLRAERETDEGVETVEAPLPALVSAGEDLAGERLTTQAERDAAKSKPVEQLDAAQLGGEARRYGAAGSPTWVLGLDAVVENRRGEIIAAATNEVAVDVLADRLLEAGLFGEWRVAAGAGEKPLPAAVQRDGARDVLVVAEVLAGALRPVSLELLAKARALAAVLGGRVLALVAAADAAAHAAALVAHGADRVLVAARPGLRSATEPHTTLLARAIERERPGVVLLPATAWGRDVAPRVAGRLGLGLTGECVDLGLDAAGRLLQHKPAFGASVVALIASRTRPEMATLRPGILAAARPAWGRTGEIVDVDLPTVDYPLRVVETRATAGAVADLEGAEVVVGFGMGIGGPENLPAIEALAEAVGGVMCTTRDVTDAGWVPKQYQVGMTGRAIAPRLYFAVALRGAFEHTVGTRRAGLIVAINKSRRAPIFKCADYGIVADWQAVVPPLTRRLRELRARAAAPRG